MSPTSIDFSDTAVAILNWNGKKWLEEFLPSVVAYSSNASIYVIDNASDDQSVEFLSKNYPGIYLIQHKTNLGFCKGYNLGLSQIKAKYFVLLNSDVEVTSDWLSAPIGYLKKNPDVAAVQPKIKSWYQKEYFEYAGAAGGAIDKFGYPFCRGRLFEEIEKDKRQYEEIAEISWASGACLFIRADLYKAEGGLDERFFAHMEEIDLCWRLKNKGYKIIYHPGSEVFHVGGGTLQKANSFKTFLNFRNSLIMLHKNLPGRELFFIVVSRLFLDGIAGIKFLLEGKPSFVISIIKAHLSYYSFIGEINNNRKKNSVSAPDNFREKYSLLWQYYIKKVRKYECLPK